METTWGPSWDDGDDVGMTWGRRGRRGDDGNDARKMGSTWGPHGDNKITKNAITFERIEIIEFRLKIWDP